MRTKEAGVEGETRMERPAGQREIAGEGRRKGRRQRKEMDIIEMLGRCTSKEGNIYIEAL